MYRLGVRVYPPGCPTFWISYPAPPKTLHSGYHTPGKDMGPEIPYPQKGPGTTPYPLVDRQTPVKTLPSRNFVCSR